MLSIHLIETSSSSGMSGAEHGSRWNIEHGLKVSINNISVDFSIQKEVSFLVFDEFDKDLGLSLDDQLHVSEVGFHNKFLSSLVVNSNSPYGKAEHVNWAGHPEGGLGLSPGQLVGSIYGIQLDCCDNLSINLNFFVIRHLVEEEVLVFLVNKDLSGNIDSLGAGKRISGFAVHGIKHGLLIHSLLANFIEFQLVSIVDNSDIMISMHMGYSSMDDGVDHMEAKVSLGLKSKIKFTFKRIPMRGHRCVDGEYIWGVDGVKLVFDEETSISFNLGVIRHLVHEEVLVHLVKEDFSCEGQLLRLSNGVQDVLGPSVEGIEFFAGCGLTVFNDFKLVGIIDNCAIILG